MPKNKKEFKEPQQLEPQWLKDFRKLVATQPTFKVDGLPTKLESIAGAYSDRLLLTYIKHNELLMLKLTEEIALSFVSAAKR